MYFVENGNLTCIWSSDGQSFGSTLPWDPRDLGLILVLPQISLGKSLRSFDSAFWPILRPFTLAEQSGLLPKVAPFELYQEN